MRYWYIAVGNKCNGHINNGQMIKIVEPKKKGKERGSQRK